MPKPMKYNSRNQGTHSKQDWLIKSGNCSLKEKKSILFSTESLIKKNIVNTFLICILQRKKLLCKLKGFSNTAINVFDAHSSPRIHATY